MGYTLKKTSKIIYKVAQEIKVPLSDLQSLSAEQVYYVNHYLDQDTFLRACPGSGKTEVIGIKSSFAISKWGNRIGGIAVTTFTNSASKELNSRIRKYGNLTTGSYPHFIGTFDSFLHNFILQPHCHSFVGYDGKDGDKSIRIVDSKSKAGFLSNYKAYITHGEKKMPVLATEFFWDGKGGFEGDTKNAKKLINDQISDEDKHNLVDCKSAFFRAGFATYGDAETLCYLILTKNEFLVKCLAKRFPILFVDECQDLSIPQMRIIQMLRLKGTKVHLVGDVNQSIYKFRKVDPTNLEKFVEHHSPSRFKEMVLSNNFRSVREIVSLSDLLMDVKVQNVSRVTGKIASPCILWQYDDNSFEKLPQKFERLIKEHGLSLAKSAILSRGKSTIQSIRSQDIKHNSRVSFFAYGLECWNKKNRCTSDMQNALSYIGRGICSTGYLGKGDSSNYYCPDFYTKVEWRLFLKTFINRISVLLPFEDNDRDLTWSQWAKRLREVLQKYWHELRGAEEFSSVSNYIRAPHGKSSICIKFDVSATKNVYNNIRTTTIHSVKGETLDAVLLLSHQDRKSRGGHYSQWFREGDFDKEHIRFAYVACSRPKFLLVVATPKLSLEFFNKFKNMGFAPQDLISNGLF